MADVKRQPVGPVITRFEPCNLSSTERPRYHLASTATTTAAQITMKMGLKLGQQQQFFFEAPSYGKQNQNFSNVLCFVIFVIETRGRHVVY